MTERTIIPAADEEATRVRHLEALRLKAFCSQWDLESIPACDEGMALLLKFADAHPGAFELARKSGFGDQTHPMFDQLERWHAFTAHVSACPKCNEV